jgi:hypothetical protein
MTNQVENINKEKITINKGINEIMEHSTNDPTELDLLVRLDTRLKFLRKDIGITEKLKKSCSEWFTRIIIGWFPRIINNMKLTRKVRKSMFNIFKTCSYNDNSWWCWRCCPCWYVCRTSLKRCG